MRPSFGPRECGLFYLSMPNPLDLTGQRFGLLTAISKTGGTRGGALEWLCRCDCGEKRTIASHALTRKTYPTRSCGCLRKGGKSAGVRTWKPSPCLLADLWR